MTGPSEQPAKATRRVVVDDVSQRVTRLEEHAAFASHEAEQLAQHVRALMAKLELLSRRIESLEARLRRAETTSDESPER